MTQAPETDRPEPEQISFELERLTLTPEHRLELTGRWFGVRGRRFVRPTLTLIGATKRSRSLADLEHKPWAAEDGTAWTAVFGLQDPGEDVEEMELAVAPDIAVSLAPPAELARLPRERAPSSRAVTAATLPAPAEPPPAEPRKPPGRSAAEVQKTIAEQRLKIQDLEKQLEQAAGSEVELRSALGRRDAAVEKLEAVLEHGQEQARERAQAQDERASAEREQQAALRERDEARQGWREAHESWGKVVRERAKTAQERDQALIARDRALAERDGLATELDRVSEERDGLAAELDRVSDKRDRAIDERGARLAERDQARTERLGTPPRRYVTPPEPRPRVPPSRQAREWVAWMTRLFALLVLAAAVAAIVIIIHAT